MKLLDSKDGAVFDTVGHKCADRAAVEHGTPLQALMGRAGAAVADAVRHRWAARTSVVLCGPGDNGGDGFIAAAQLRAAGWPVRVAALKGTDASPAARAARTAWGADVVAIDSTDPQVILGTAGLVVDALFGAGLNRPLTGSAGRMIDALMAARDDRIVVAADVPSGVDADTGVCLGAVAAADLTVTFWRLKPAHLLGPARRFCGEVVLADIGHPPACREAAAPVAWVNGPGLWAGGAPDAGVDTHKHARGRLAVATGALGRTGAARLAARAGLRAGAGVVTLLTPPAALGDAAGQSTAVMTESVSDAEGLGAAAGEADAVVIGPAFGRREAAVGAVAAVLAGPGAAVLDADALSAFERDPHALFFQMRPGDVITPHAGEFRRLFADLADQDSVSAAQVAAARCGAVVVLKGAATVIAAPDRTPVINVHAGPDLATAGSGDVLAGIIGGFIAQSAAHQRRRGAGGWDSFHAACAGVWVHGAAGLLVGPGLIAEDLPEKLPVVLRALRERARKAQAQERLQKSAPATSPDTPSPVAPHTPPAHTQGRRP